MRHAKSDWEQGLADRERPLASRGEHDAPRMGQWMQDLGWVPDHALVSPARRAQQTYALAASAWDQAPSKDTVDVLYGGHMGDYLDALAASDAGTVMLVAHDPTMTDLVRHLAPDAPRTDTGKTMPTGSVALFEDRKLVALQWPKHL